MRWREAARKLEAAGFTRTGQRGSHIRFARHSSDGSRFVTLPRHREIAPGTLGSIRRQAGLTPREFEDL